MVGVFSLKLDANVNEDCYRYLLEKVSEERRKKLLEYRNRGDVYRSLFAEFLVKYVAAQRMKISNEELIIRYSSYGKPYFTGIENFHFNLSHSGDWVVCAISDCPVGIDIEEAVPLDLNAMAFTLSADEQTDLYRQKTDHQLAYFYELWTLKESFVKQSGEGLSKQLSAFSMKIGDERITFEQAENTSKQVFFKQYDIDPKYKIAVCAETNDFAQIVQLSLEEVVGAF